ncbi:hypothetical protein RCL1_001945 [Eukaryota sp. TZLM3-RCL]
MSFEDDYDRSKPVRTGDSEYVTLHTSISKLLQSITGNTNRFEQFLQQVGTPKDSIEFRQRAVALARKSSDEITTLARLLSNFSKLQGSTAQEESQRSMDRKRFSTSSEAVRTRFQQLHSDWTKATAKVVLNPVAQSNSVNNSERQALLDSQRSEQLQQQAQIVHNKALIEETEQSVAQIAKDLSLVNSMYREIAVLVTEQGEQVEAIDAHFTIVENQTASAATHLERAAASQRKNRSKMCCLLLLLIVLAGFAVVYVYYQSGKKD